MKKTLERVLLKKMRDFGDEAVFSPHDFVEFGNRSAIDVTLHRLVRENTIRRLIRGLYYVPKLSPFLGQELTPDMDAIAQALARKFGWRIQPSGAIAENLLGLSTQVPAKAVYLSDGPSRTYRIGNTTLSFKHTALKEVGFKLRESGLVVHALKSIGREHITPEVIAQIRERLPEPLRTKVLMDSKSATGWVRAVLQRAAGE
jgi:hypothetical protein